MGVLGGKFNRGVKRFAMAALAANSGTPQS
jgi:hypothetical protein